MSHSLPSLHQATSDNNTSLDTEATGEEDHDDAAFSSALFQQSATEELATTTPSGMTASRQSAFDSASPAQRSPAQDQQPEPHSPANRPGSSAGNDHHFGASSQGSLSSFSSSRPSHAATHGQPMMPLFTPVLQRFQSQHGSLSSSNILQEEESYQDRLGLPPPSKSSSSSPHPSHHPLFTHDPLPYVPYAHTHHQVHGSHSGHEVTSRDNDDDDDDDDDEHHATDLEEAHKHLLSMYNKPAPSILTTAPQSLQSQNHSSHYNQQQQHFNQHQNLADSSAGLSFYNSSKQQGNNHASSLGRSPLRFESSLGTGVGMGMNMGNHRRPQEDSRFLHPSGQRWSDEDEDDNDHTHQHRHQSEYNGDHDLGTEHEAPASLMIEMNHKDPEDERESPWHRAKRRISYKRPGMNMAELAMWKWVNVENLDNFLSRAYDYYMGKGIYTILLERCLRLMTFAFVIGFSAFLGGCVDYSVLKHSRRLSDALVPQCIHQMSTSAFVILLLFGSFWVGQVVKLIYDVPSLIDMCNFYTFLLDIPDEDIQTVSWPEVINRIIKIRDNNPNTTTTATIQTTSTQRLNAHGIANRIMRKENYMVAIFNKELLDLTVPVPFLSHRTILTRILEWSLGFCILGYVFDDRGQVRKRFIKGTRRHELVEGLRRRFRFMGFITLLFSPFITIYLVLYFFFRYFEEYHKDPSSIGTRQYTPLAKWKFKEFNELPHFFEARINASYPLAMKYINQFPKEKTTLVCRFVAFVSGAFAAVLALITIFDQELLLGLEITSERTVFFYIGVFGTVMAISRGMIPDLTETFDPGMLIQGVVDYTHYFPDEWTGKLHTDEIRKQFALLFEYKVVLLLLEFMSLLLTPLILCLSLPNCSEQIVDFFREFTVHVDGIGYVCSFAVFDMKRHGNVKYGAPANVAVAVDEHYLSNQGKMEKSFINFKQHNPDWEPQDLAGSMFLSTVQRADDPVHGLGRYRTGGMAESHLRPGMAMQDSIYLQPRGYSSAQRHGRRPHGVQKQQSRHDGHRSPYSTASDEDEHTGKRARAANLGRKGLEESNIYGHSTSRKSNIRFADHTVREGTHYDPTMSTDSFGSGHDLAEGHGHDHGGSSSQERRPGMDSDEEDGKPRQKNGVFALLNQIYEINNVTL